jgi:hypothetical protein
MDSNLKAAILSAVVAIVSAAVTAVSLLTNTYITAQQTEKIEEKKLAFALLQFAESGSSQKLLIATC